MRSAVEIAPTGSRPAIRLRPVPRCDPPFDDELTPAAWASAQQLALEWPRPLPPRAPSGGTRDRPAPPGTQIHGTAAHMAAADASSGDARGSGASTGSANGRGTSPGGAHDRSAFPRGAHGSDGARDCSDAGAHGRQVDAAALGSLASAPVVAGPSGEAKLAVKRFVHLCVEVLNGHRPAAHLRRLSVPAEAADVVAQGLAGARRVAEMRRPRRPGDRRPKHGTPVAVLRVNLCSPRTGAVEAAVALVTGDRTWAMALRLELHGETWAATAMRLI